jgi:hypothetical protein
MSRSILGHLVSGECLEVIQLGGILRRHDETEVMPVIPPAHRECPGVCIILGGAGHASLLAAPGDAVALQVCDVCREWCRADGAALADDAGLDDDAAIAAQQPAAAERGAASPECPAPRATSQR